MWWTPENVKPIVGNRIGRAANAQAVFRPVRCQDMFDGFRLDRVDVGDVRLRVRHGGRGPAVLLLHGHPRTHATWHDVAPPLARDYTVVCPDLRGYGQSSKPPDGPGHVNYSKREMAADCLALMHSLGHDRFAVVGHDRGSYVALRLALDHPEAVTRLAFLGLVPIGEALARVNARFAANWYHWFFYAQPGLPERLINADPDAHYHLGGTAAEAMGQENYADVRSALHDPATVHAMLEDYRAGLGIDRAHDDADKAAGRTVACPTLVLWAANDEKDQDLYPDILGIWKSWAPDLRGGAFSSGHHMAEENPVELVRVIRDFLSDS
jgi:haloacetate dehalogenase